MSEPIAADSDRRSSSEDCLSPARIARFAAALPFLVEAARDADSIQADRWQFALTLRELQAADLTGTDLRWLVSRGFLQHRTEQVVGSGSRSFDSVPDLAIGEHSCFLLTEAGLQFTALPQFHMPGSSRPESDLPHWDASTRELRWRGRLVKRFRTPAPQQELILSVFEEENWARRIDDPLGRESGMDPHQRLHDALRRLNGNQLEGHIRFSRDGTGEGICWGIKENPDTPLS